MAFLSQFRNIQKSSDDSMMFAEVDYNFGRAFHRLGMKPFLNLTSIEYDVPGLHSHTVTHCECVLEIAGKRVICSSSPSTGNRFVASLV
jgi:general transcription factor 3C polypeptide 3 (transcription factor C subunit 4)